MLVFLKMVNYFISKNTTLVSLYPMHNDILRISRECDVVASFEHFFHQFLYLFGQELGRDTFPIFVQEQESDCIGRHHTEALLPIWKEWKRETRGHKVTIMTHYITSIDFQIEFQVFMRNSYVVTGLNSDNTPSPFIHLMFDSDVGQVTHRKWHA